VRFIERVKDGEDSADHLPLMKGWRYELAGRHLLAMLEGKVSLSVKAKNRHVQVMEKDPEES
jgi:hypothetical protein